MSRSTFNKNQEGFKLIELLIVLALIGVLSAMALPYILNYKKLYKSEDQALKMMDVMREAGQLALTKRRTMRFEIDLTDNAMLLIDESSSPAQQVKKIPLEQTKDIRVDVLPTGLSKPNPPNYSDAAFATDTLGHNVGTTSITGHNIWAARFRSDGSVVNSLGVPLSANIYIWPPLTPGSTSPRNKTEVRAITIFGGSGAIRYWRNDGTNFVPYL